MSSWHRNNPELYESGYEPWDSIEAEGDALRKRRRAGEVESDELTTEQEAEVAERELDSERRIQAMQEGVGRTKRPRE